MMGPLFSTHPSLPCGSPHGSLLGYILFLLHLLPFASLSAKHDLAFCLYLDELQIYMPIKSNRTDVNTLMSGIVDIRYRLAPNFLYLNDSETGYILFGTKSTLNAVADLL